MAGPLSAGVGHEAWSVTFADDAGDAAVRDYSVANIGAEGVIAVSEMRCSPVIPFPAALGVKVGA